MRAAEINIRKRVKKRFQKLPRFFPKPAKTGVFADCPLGIFKFCTFRPRALFKSGHRAHCEKIPFDSGELKELLKDCVDNPLSDSVEFFEENSDKCFEGVVNCGADGTLTPAEISLNFAFLRTLIAASFLKAPFALKSNLLGSSAPL
mgnify:CR=1 FL=1